MTSTHFDPWRPEHLQRFLRTWAQLADQQRDVAAADVRDALELDDETALAALSRLRTLELLADSGTSNRIGDNLLSTPRVLTRAGVLAAMHGIPTQ